MMEERVIEEANNITVYKFMVSPQRNESEYLIKKVAFLKINVGN